MIPIRRTTATITLAAGLGLPLMPTASHAIEPTTQVQQLVVRASSTCPSGVVIANQWDVTRVVTTFYDNDGTPVMRIVHGTGEGTVTNTATGFSLPQSFVRVIHVDLVTGESFDGGRNVTTHIPDGGEALPGAGRTVFDATGQVISNSGPDPVAERAEVCAALGA